jgi:hypothetical protein
MVHYPLHVWHAVATNPPLLSLPKVSAVDKCAGLIIRLPYLLGHRWRRAFSFSFSSFFFLIEFSRANCLLDPLRPLLVSSQFPIKASL